MRFTEQGRFTETKHDDASVLEELEVFLQADARPKLIMSDFDETLCHDYVFDASTNNHTAKIDPELAAEVAKLPLIIATATRAMHPKIQQIRDSGMVQSSGVLVAENGGVIIGRDGDIRWSAVEDGTIDILHEQIIEELPELFTMPQDMKLVAKRGLTLMVLRAQKDNGHPDRRIQADLQAALQTIVGEQWLVVDGGRSLSVQPPGVSKIGSLAHTGIETEDYCTVGIGDGANDINILKAADVAVSVGERIAEHADLVVGANTEQITAVLKSIGRTTLGFAGLHKQNNTGRKKDES